MLGSAIALFFATGPASAIEIKSVIKGADSYVYKKDGDFYSDIFSGYVMGIGEATQIKLCVPPDTSNGEILSKVAYSILRHKELYNGTSKTLVEFALVDSFPCS